MKTGILRLLGIETGEESMVTLLLAQSVFLGIFVGAFDISAHSFFLSVFDEKMMARGYVLSGLAGIILTFLFTYFQKKIGFSFFSVLNLVFVTIVTFALWILLTATSAGWVIWLLFIMLGPLNILALLGFWGTAGRLFSLRQGKRLFGLVDAGLIAGIIVISYAIPLLLGTGLRPEAIIVISAAGALGASIIQGITGSRFTFNGSKERNSDLKSTGGKKQSLLKTINRDHYTGMMALFIVLSVMTAFFVQYSFMAVTREQYPAEEDLARFLGFFTGSMMVFTLLIKLLAFSYLIRNYGLKICLLISPLIIGAFTLVAALTGLFSGFTPAAAGFMFFFMLLAMSRLFSKSLKDSLESPSLKVVYQAVDEEHRYDVQAGMDGTVNEIAALTAGLILSGLGFLSFISLIHFSIVLVFITGLWFFVAWKLYAGYRNSIRKALDTVKDSPLNSDEEAYNAHNYKSRFIAAREFRNDYFCIIKGNTGMLEEKPACYYQILAGKAESEKDINLLPALRTIAASPSIGREIREKCATIAESLELVVSGDTVVNDKLFPAKMLLYGSRMPQVTEILRLLRDKSARSRQLGLYMIGKFRVQDMISELCLSLQVPELEDQAAKVLGSFGEDAFEELKRFSLTSSGNVEVTKRLVRLMGSGCESSNLGFLFPRLWSNSRQVRETALRELEKCRFSPSEDERDRLNQLISDIIGIMTWNLSAAVVLKKSNDTELSESLDFEIKRWNDFLFRTLSVTYDTGSVKKIRENLEAATLESVNYALEMVDMIFDDQVKPKIIPLFDMISDEERIKQLYQFFPAEIPERSILIEDILNRDFNLLGIWIRAKALREMKELQNENTGESIVALLFSPWLILREEAAGVLARENRELYSGAVGRLAADDRKHLIRIIEGKMLAAERVYEKVEFLSSCLDEDDREKLIYPALSMVYTESVTADNIPESGGFIIWPLNGYDGRIIYDDAADFLKTADEKKAITCYILPLKAVDEFSSRFPERAGAILNYIERKSN
ncbi:MAG: hypothetical protein JXR66_06280 [Bacteroidales bacterium]|nr:hypothetical protein [Bacteroidales bacterium]MBN2633143.1 hypothetical protein [Bacteroidales bacterium]